MRHITPLKRGGVYTRPVPFILSSIGNAAFDVPPFSFVGVGGANVEVGGAASTLCAPGILFSATGTVSAPDGAIFDVPPFSIEINTGGRQDNAALDYSVSLTGTSQIVGKLNECFSQFDFNVTGFGTSQGILDEEIALDVFITSASGGVLDISLAPISLLATGTTAGLGSALIEVPPFSFNTLGSIGVLGGASICVPPFEMLWGISRIEVPNFCIVATGLSSVTTPQVAYAFNTHLQELTRYTSYDFDFIVQFNGKYYGLRGDGMYLLEGTNDNGTNINALVKTAPLDFNTLRLKRVRKVYVGSDDDVDVSPFVDNTIVGNYRSSLGKKRVQLPRGPKGRYWAFQLENVKGDPMRIDNFEILPTVLRKKI